MYICSVNNLDNLCWNCVRFTKEHHEEKAQTFLLRLIMWGMFSRKCCFVKLIVMILMIVAIMFCKHMISINDQFVETHMLFRYIRAKFLNNLNSFNPNVVFVCFFLSAIKIRCTVVYYNLVIKYIWLVKLPLATQWNTASLEKLSCNTERHTTPEVDELLFKTREYQWRNNLLSFSELQ